MRRLVPILMAAMLAACGGRGDEAAIVLYDNSFSVAIIADNSDGITSPDGLLWADGVLYIADEGGSAIRKLEGAVLTTLADKSSGIISPEDLRLSADGTLYFTDDSAGGLWRVTPRGAERVAGSEGMSESEGIAVDPAGGVDVGDGASGRVFHVSENGVSEELIAARMSKPESMVRAPDGSLFVADNRTDHLYRFTAGEARREIMLPSDLSPESIALHGSTLWITDSSNGRLYRMEQDGEPETVALFLADFANINGIAAAPNGRIFISIQSDLSAGEGYIVALSPTAASKR
ncbi:SMP-30/gluconolactonase/LRE family protein [Qipengyuania marisflavi]|uniref:SMP-30/Gluconolactonase/LRE-like region domain-containing protein n=1 Tax=Qipengyuania marisflavi TaxID=2486356 RepID=A0A5S3P7R2_9SPHN|nr:SMP-30/gluconolactonase/LRE family protein [Qipengyuania marisflavi]TMM49072.1 hypothetical protein FEV51_06815 [Qipengyuania marisflavi]